MRYGCVNVVLHIDFFRKFTFDHCLGDEQITTISDDKHAETETCYCFVLFDTSPKKSSDKS